MVKKDKQIDSENKRKTPDILRAIDIIPAATKKSDKDVRFQSFQPTEKQPKQAIPQFDLAEDIMAEQRKLAGQKRKKPGEKTGIKEQKPEIETIESATPQSFTVSPEPEQIIKEIVARDIMLYRGKK